MHFSVGVESFERFMIHYLICIMTSIMIAPSTPLPFVDTNPPNSILSLEGQDAPLVLNESNSVQIDGQTEGERVTETIPSALVEEGFKALKCSARNGVKFPSQRWPNARIPYIFDDALDGSLLPNIKTAMATFHTHTCVRFVQRADEQDYIRIRSTGKDCSAPVGRQNGESHINLGPKGCNLIATVIHELNHAVGFYHEQNREDRDQYVNIITSNIQPEYLSQFDIEPTDSQRVAYDYKSIMHYDAHAFAIDATRPTITAKLPGVTIGGSTDLTPSDIVKINRMYGCTGYDQGYRMS